MPFQSNGEIHYFQFKLFDGGPIHAVFTRRGGVSPDPWASLNLGGSVGDDLQHVGENRRLALVALGLNLDSAFDVWQVHGIEVAIAESPRSPGSQEQRDIILTNKLGVSLLMRFADCVPMLLYDPVRKVVGIAHAGWMGTVRGAARAAIEAMQFRFGSDSADIQAAIGPSIGPDHYQIGPDVVAQVRQAFAGHASKLLAERNGSTYFDLWAANHLILEQAGVQQVEVAGLCTACHTDDWFSHRAEHGRTGRFGAIIALRD